MTPRQWAVWGLPRAARVLVFAVVSAYLVALAFGVATVRTSLRDAVLATAFAVASVVSVEVSMRMAWPRKRGERIGRDCLCVWILPVALLLPPVYVGVMVVVPCLYVHLRVWRAQLMKLVYSTAGLGLGYMAASWVHGALLGHRQPWSATQLVVGPRAQLALLAAVAAWWLGHNLLMCAVVALTAGADPVRTFIHDVESHVIDVAAACAGIAFALLFTLNPAAALLLVPPVLLMQHHQYSGLRQAVRRDSLTNLANPQYWRDVAAREVDRAWASGSRLAVLLIDVDHFKAVNDRFGHLAGDDVLAAISRAIVGALRPGDLVGRLGGEEFGAVLVGLNLLDAHSAAERVRDQVSEVRVRSDQGEWISVTVSLGVAELSVSGSNLLALTAAADRALYAAKAAGRNAVRVAAPDEHAIDLTLRTPTARP